MEKKHLVIDYIHWKELNKIKLDLQLTKLDEVISHMIETYYQCKKEVDY